MKRDRPASRLKALEVSDPSKETATAYGVLSERGFANRWTFYIGKDGTITAIGQAGEARNVG